MTATRTRTRVQHPGWACCDLEQDLAGWLARQRVLVAGLREVARDHRDRGRQFRELELKTLTAEGPKAAYHWQLLCIEAHGVANAYAQDALIVEGHLDRVEEAHAWRLKPAEIRTGVAA